MPNVRIKSWLGCGTALIGRMYAPGHFREELQGEGLFAPSTYVEYLFFTLLFLPICPIGCYRVQESRDGARRILSTEQYRAGELLNIYMIWLMPAFLVFVCLVS